MRFRFRSADTRPLCGHDRECAPDAAAQEALATPVHGITDANWNFWTREWRTDPFFRLRYLTQPENEEAVLIALEYEFNKSQKSR